MTVTARSWGERVEEFKYWIVVDPKYAKEKWMVLDNASDLSFEDL